MEKKGTTRSNVDPKLRKRRDLKKLLLQKKIPPRKRGGCVLGFFKHTCRS